ncbi:SDR family NAD(P)-dependent oxidoreductase [Streptomyces sp. NRRL B-1347]|uniref:SDR family NAD(P)-dependent oxidoreductase n=1 Tax=Streptomyces sp. NRRL B-1347 TaxID=1476877 RepID=UPI0004C4B43D|nr:SDR family NAD(P)-dependent oxidoreductase [Streptomyces sp. NRRL B-1347]
MTELRLDTADLLAFAEAVGDHNPLHVDPAFARRSVFGRPVAHGALAVSAVLGLTALPEELSPLTELVVHFDQPVLCGISYTVVRRDTGAELRLGPARVLSARWRHGTTAPPSAAAGTPDTAGAAPATPSSTAARTPEATGTAPQEAIGTDPAAPPPQPGAVRGAGTATDEARPLTVRELAALPEESGTWEPDPRKLARLLHRLTGTVPPASTVMPLAWASWFTGMRTPGRDALLVGIRLHPACAGRPEGTWRYRVDAPGLHPRSGLVTCTASLCYGGQSPPSVLTVTSLLRHRIADPEPAQTAAALPPSRALSGRAVAVVGASRGLGAALAYCLAGQGARVLAVSSTPAPHLRAHARAAGLDVRPVVCDARDADGLRAALADGGAVDGLILAAAPRVNGFPVAPAAVSPCVDHIADAARMAIAPVAALRGTLRPGAFVVFISSTAAVDSSPQWPHYATGKAAVEGFARHLSQHEAHLRVLVARPPRMWTEMANSPTGSAGAASPVDVAAGIVARLLSSPHPRRPPGCGPEVLGPADLRPQRDGRNVTS